MDERIFQKKDAVVGENFPPFHPNCVCQAVDYDGNRLTAEGLQAEAEQQEVKEYFDELTDEERFVMTALTEHLRSQGDASFLQLENFLKGDFSSSWKGEPMSVHIKSASIMEEQAKKISALADTMALIAPATLPLKLLVDITTGRINIANQDLTLETVSKISEPFIQKAAQITSIWSTASSVTDAILYQSQIPDFEIDISKSYGDYFINSHYNVTVDGKVTKLREEKVDLHGGTAVRSDKADPYFQMQTQIRIDDQELQKSKWFYKKE